MFMQGVDLSLNSTRIYSFKGLTGFEPSMGKQSVIVLDTKFTASTPM
jgi:hypothetical protein